MTKEIIKFESVTIPATEYYSRETGKIDLSLRAGESLLLQIQKDDRCPPLADATSGLLAPEKGRILFCGRDWADLSPDEAAACRGRIGRVFEENAWISNLDIDENIMLAQRHHSQRQPDLIIEEALTLANYFGLTSLPCTRPAWTHHGELIISQWIRALLGSPLLLILEQPGRRATAEACAKFVDAVLRRQTEGSATVWITGDPRIVNNPALKPTVSLIDSHNKLATTLKQKARTEPL